MNHEKWLELADLHALDALDGEDLNQIRSHLAVGCVECEERIGQTSKLLSSFALSLNPASPPKALKSKILSQLPRPHTFHLSKPIFFALGSSAVAACVLMFWLIGTIPSKDAMGHSPEMQKLLTSKDTHPISFAPMHDDTRVRGALLWNFNKCGGCLMLKNFLKAPAGKIYALWGTDKRKKTHLLGTFNADEEGRAHLDVSISTQHKDIVQFTITAGPIGHSQGTAGSGTLELFSSVPII